MREVDGSNATHEPSVAETTADRVLIAAALRHFALRLEVGRFEGDYLPAMTAANAQQCRALAARYMPQGGSRRSFWTPNVTSTAE